MKKKKEPKGVVTFRTNMKEDLEEFARKDNRTVSNVVNIAVKEFLARRKIGV